MLKMPDENKFPGVSNYIHDYGMNLVVLKNLSKEKEERFQSDFKYLVKYLRNCKEPELYGPVLVEIMENHCKSLLTILIFMII